MERSFPLDAVWHPRPLDMACFHAGWMATVLFLAMSVRTLRSTPNRRTTRGWAMMTCVIPIIAIAPFHRLTETRAESFPVTMTLVCVAVMWLISMVNLEISARRLRKIGVESSIFRIAVVILSIELAAPVLVYLMKSPVSFTRAPPSAQCRNNLKQLWLTWHNLAEKRDEQLIPAVSGDPALSWRVTFLPELGQAQLRRNYNDQMIWDSDENTPVARKQMPAYICPSGWHGGQDALKRYFSEYVMVTGPASIGEVNRNQSFHAVTDGLSNTLLFVEAAGLNVVWTEPRDADIDTIAIGVNLPGTTKEDSPGLMSSFHMGGANAALADGSVQFISEDIDPEVLKNLTTINDGREFRGNW